MMPPLATLIILTPRLHLFSATSFIKSETSTSTNLVGSTSNRNVSQKKGRNTTRSQNFSNCVACSECIYIEIMTLYNNF